METKTWHQPLTDVANARDHLIAEVRAYVKRAGDRAPILLIAACAALDRAEAALNATENVR